jgi:hypothetical protein
MLDADREIFFDLFRHDPVITQSELYDGFKHLVFEEFLQYVEFPHLQFERDQGPARGNNQAVIKPDGSGRSDLQTLFNWLREEKKVKIILKVIVDDLQEPAHSDEAIEACLRGMGVEIWDWKKMDLCSDVILKVAPDVREVHLHWSGNNGILRGWSEEYGLRQLKQLKKVYLHIQPVCQPKKYFTLDSGTNPYLPGPRDPHSKTRVRQSLQRTHRKGLGYQSRDDPSKRRARGHQRRRNRRDP